jgi:hypothetical protein
MTRTQISLEDKQYLYIKRVAVARATSLSAVIRELIESHMAAQSAEGPRLEDMTGFFSGGGLEGVDHDHYLYGWPKRSAEPDA